MRRGQCRLPGGKPFPRPLATLLHCSYAGQRPQLGSESFFYGLPKATLDTHGPRPHPASLWPVRSLPLLFFWASEGNVREEACRKLFLWASEGDVRHPRAPPSNASRQPAGLPRPLCGLSEACLFSSSGLPKATLEKRHAESFFYGLPKATLDTHGPRPQTLLGSRQACPGLSVACPKPASSLLLGSRRQR